MKNKNWFYVTIILTVLFIAGSVWFKIYQENVLVEQFYGALLGVVITAIITVLLRYYYYKGRLLMKKKEIEASKYLKRNKTFITSFWKV